MDDETLPVEREFLLLNEKDNILTALKDLKKGTQVDTGEAAGELILLDDIHYAHKFARRLIPAGAEVIKYGEVIGRATTAIPPGAHVHVHNVESIRARGGV